MFARIWNAALTLAVTAAGFAFFVTYGYGLKAIFRDFGMLAFLSACASHAIVWLGIALLFDKRHPPEP